MYEALERFVGSAPFETPGGRVSTDVVPLGECGPSHAVVGRDRRYRPSYRFVFPDVVGGASGILGGPLVEMGVS
ncbi:hypothetical protein I7X12_12740 [Halosimplex litoreum]|uniref:Uncharacterized protein n=1 Tax=Halosimplex litoreum TaxID=1198301 RepID=A0A7T3KUC8_9EURY|nr:hypothetical protein [Halosimplex litoreum]QPV61620.1 hypothetical protein I7X12_12740 [Halosimplex litoreum]